MASIHVDEPIDEEEQQVPEQVPTQLPVQQNELSQSKITGFLANPNKRLIIFAALVIVLFLAYSYKTNYEKRQLQEQLSTLESKKGSSETVDDEAQQLKEEVGHFLELPADEDPTVATVVDAEKVRGQTFFKNAQNGDKVLLFASSGKAILYRPSTSKIIEVAPINLGDSSSQNQGTAADQSTKTE